MKIGLVSRNFDLIWKLATKRHTIWLMSSLQVVHSFIHSSIHFQLSEIPADTYNEFAAVAID